jgi:hypothetical protein
MDTPPVASIAAAGRPSRGLDPTGDHVIRNIGMFEHQMTPALTPEYKAKIFRKPPGIGKRNVLKVPVRKPLQ